MAKSPPPIVYIFLVLLLGGGGWYFYRSGSLSLPTISLPWGGGVNTLSDGEKVLLPDPQNPSKVAAAELIKQGNLAAAIPVLQAAVQANRNDPEALIYLNNALAEQQGDPLVLGVAVPISTNPDRARETLRGVAQAQQQFAQKGGVQNRLLQVVVADDGDNPNQAKAVASAFIRRKDVLGVLGHSSSQTALAAGPLYQESPLAMISSTNTSTEISALGDAIFRVVPSDQIAGTQLARYALNQLRAKSVAIFYNAQDAYSNSLRNAFSTTILTEGGQIAGEYDLAQSGFAATTALQAAVAAGSQAVFLAPNGATAPQSLEVARANAALSKRLPLLGGDVLFSFTTLKEGGSAVQGLVVAIPWHPLLPGNRAFAQRAEQQWGGQVSWRTALAYDATQVFLAAITRSGSAISREAILQALNAPNFSVTETASGPIRFLPSGDREGSNILVQVKPGQRSGTGFDFIPLSTVPQ
ncbi:MAG: ABC transporter substrate-binding protein [Cyanobacteriota bacterium]|nr:ABC transporter substrate-binding protein [Cyanobacteriota bacterium]